MPSKLAYTVRDNMEEKEHTKEPPQACGIHDHGNNVSHPHHYQQHAHLSAPQKSLPSVAAPTEPAGSGSVGAGKASAASAEIPSIDKSKCITIKLQLPKAPTKAGLIITDDPKCGLPVLVNVHKTSPIRDQVPESLILGYWIISIKDVDRLCSIETRSSESLQKELNAFQRVDSCVTVEITFCKQQQIEQQRTMLSGATEVNTGCPSNDEEHENNPPGTSKNIDNYDQGKKSNSCKNEKNASSTSENIDNNDEGSGGIGGNKSNSCNNSETFNNNDVTAASASGGKQGTDEGDDTNDEEIEDDNPFNNTEEELDRIKAIEKEALELFPPNRKDILYENYHVLKAAFQEKIGDKYGFKVENLGASFQCTRSDTSKSYLRQLAKRRKDGLPESKRRKRPTARCNCTFKLGYCYPYKKAELAGKSRAECRVYITNVSYKHSHGCSGVLPVILTFQQKDELEKAARGARRLKRKQTENRLPYATEMVDHFRPMFRALAKHPQQKSFLAALEGLKCAIEGKEGPSLADAAASKTTLGEVGVPAKDSSEENESSEEIC